MKCGKCGGNCKLITTTSKEGKNYSIGRGLLGALLCGPVGLTWGDTAGRQLNVEAYWTCENCGNKVKA